MSEKAETLYTVHAQDPDELYAAASEEEADTMATTPEQAGTAGEMLRHHQSLVAN